MQLIYVRIPGTEQPYTAVYDLNCMVTKLVHPDTGKRVSIPASTPTLQYRVGDADTQWEWQTAPRQTVLDMINLRYRKAWAEFLAPEVTA